MVEETKGDGTRKSRDNAKAKTKATIRMRTLRNLRIKRSGDYIN